MFVAEVALMCLALNVYHEARNYPRVEQFAVAAVVMNRVADDGFPNTVCDVVYQGGEARRHRCQFSWYCDGRPDTPYEWPAWHEAKRVAGWVLEGYMADPTGGALYYHAPYVDPWWAHLMTETYRDDAHIFYKEE